MSINMQEYNGANDKNARRSMLKMMSDQAKASKEQADLIDRLIQELDHSLIEMENLHAETKENTYEVIKARNAIMKVGEFVVDFHNEYKEHDRVSSAQKKELKKAMQSKTTDITRLIFPRIDYSRERKSAFFKEWNRVNIGMWSVYKHKVNDGCCGYDETPKVKFIDAKKYINNMSLGDYIAYRDGRLNDVDDFIFELKVPENLTLDKIINPEIMNNIIEITQTKELE